MLKTKTRGRYRNTRPETRSVTKLADIPTGAHSWSTPLPFRAWGTDGSPFTTHKYQEKGCATKQEATVNISGSETTPKSNFGRFQAETTCWSTGHRANQEHADPEAPLLLHCPEEKAHQEHCHQGQSFVVAWLEEAKPHF